MKNEKYWVEKKCLVCKINFWSLIKRNQKTCSSKCSGLYVAQCPDRVEKIKLTKLKLYGSETYVNSEKAKRTCLDKYGFDNPSKSDIVKNKIIQSNQKKYGVDYSWQNEDVKKKIQNTNLERYGVENVSQSSIIKNRVKETNVKSLGVENPFQSETIKEKIKSANVLLYGCDHYSKTNEFKNRVKLKHQYQFYKIICKSHKLNSLVTPLFSEKDYVSTNRVNQYKFQCKKCNDIFLDHIDGGHLPRCLKCYPYIQGFSIGEKEIVDFLKINIPNEIIIEKSRSVINGLELDIYIPTKKIAIEYDGLYWHSENGGKKDKKYHLNKTELCSAKGIKLIHIFEDEWFFKKDILKEKIKHILGLNTDNVYARKCEIKELSSLERDNFLILNHIQGNCKSPIRIGLYYNNELVSVMTLGGLRVALGNEKTKIGEYELVRYATSKNVIGGCSKLLKYFVSKYSPTSIVSYADRRFSGVTNVYEKTGFKLVSSTTPNYWYFKPGYIVKYHRFGFRKSELLKKLPIFDPNLTEWQNMQLNGYDRIWDCGHFKYEMVIN